MGWGKYFHGIQVLQIKLNSRINPSHLLKCSLFIPALFEDLDGPLPKVSHLKFINFLQPVMSLPTHSQHSHVKEAKQRYGRPILPTQFHRHAWDFEPLLAEPLLLVTLSMGILSLIHYPQQKFKSCFHFKSEDHTSALYVCARNAAHQQTYIPPCVSNLDLIAGIKNKRSP